VDRRAAAGPTLHLPYAAARPGHSAALLSWCWPSESGRTSRSSAW
jgi:hypothetical protein